MSVTTENKSEQKRVSSWRFTRADRLLDAGSFESVFKKPTRSRDALFTVLSRPSGGEGARLGLAISRKNCRLAVQRNRLKRLVRESFRSHKAVLCGLDIVVMCQPAAGRASNGRVFDSLAAHWQKAAAAKRTRTGRKEG
jgi:ribonuclease P protein component